MRPDQHAIFIALALCLAACGPVDQASEVGVGKGDTARPSNDHGAIAFGVTEQAIPAGQPSHAWSFTVFGPASLTIEIFATARDGRATEEPDTRTFIHRRRDDGSWGTAIRITPLPRFEVNAEAGTYRLEVQTRNDASLEPFAVRVGCQGAGCSPPREGDWSLVVPIVSATSGVLLADLYNGHLMVDGLAPLPKTVTIRGDSKPFTDTVATALQAFDQLGIDDYPLTHTLPHYYGQALCYAGDPEAIMGRVPSLAGSVFSQQLVVWAWRTPHSSGSYYQERHGEPEPPEIRATYDRAWNAYVPATGAILLVYGNSDGTSRYSHLVPACWPPGSD